MSKQEKLNQIYKEIEGLDPEVLPDLNKMIRLYSQAQMIIGFLDAESLYDSGSAYSTRKQQQAEIIQNTQGTVAEKESEAEVQTYELRLAEHNAKSESRKWSNLFKSMDNLIIALRRDERVVMEEYKKTNDLQGR